MILITADPRGTRPSFGAVEMARKLRPEERELWKKVADTATPLAPLAKMEMPRALSLPKAKIERPAPVQPAPQGL